MNHHSSAEGDNRRILLIDDNPQIHADFTKILGGERGSGASDFESAAADFFGESAAPAHATQPPVYELDSALQGQQALEKVLEARRQGRPFALAFCDVRMPPGWDGVETLGKLWEADPDLQAVMCTAFSDYSYDETIARLGLSDRLLILKKPFDPIEVQQMAGALAAKWNSALRERLRLEEVRSYAASLETVNRALRTDKATAEAFAAGKSAFLGRVGQELSGPAAEILEACRALEALCHEPASSSVVIGEVERIGERGARLLRMLEALVDLSHAETGELELRTANCDFGALVAQALADARLRRHPVARRPVLRGHLPEVASLDGKRVEQILRALACFAGAASTSNGASLCAERLSERGSGTTLWRIEARAPGLRLDGEQRSRLFEAFDAPVDWLDAELSLDLARARRLARLMGGELRYEQLDEQLGALQLVLDPGESDSRSAAA